MKILSSMKLLDKDSEYNTILSLLVFIHNYNLLSTKYRLPSFHFNIVTISLFLSFVCSFKPYTINNYRTFSLITRIFFT